jgi:hypothetical protein
MNSTSYQQNYHACPDSVLDLRLAGYFVNSVWQFSGKKIEFAIAGSKCERPAEFAK